MFGLFSRAPALRGAFLSIGLSVLAVAPSQAAPANSLRALFAQLGHCLARTPSPLSGEITIRFSLRRDGALLGKPKITYVRLPPDPVERRRFLENIAVAFDRCLPADITDALGAAIAGRPFSLHLILGRHATGV
jgi:hypothetical protein